MLLVSLACDAIALGSNQVEVEDAFAMKRTVLPTVCIFPQVPVLLHCD